jgi:hypothetical protein
MRSSTIRGLWLAAFFLTAQAAIASPAPGAPSTSRPAAPIVVADFETQVPEGTHSGNVQVKIVVDPGAAASGMGCLQIRLVNSSEDAYVIFPLPTQAAGIDPRSKLVASIRRGESGKPIRMHWFALNADNWVIFQRQFEFDQGVEWAKMEWPLSQWRWGDQRAGDWSDVRSIALRVESEVTDIYLDDITLWGESTSDAFREEFLRAAAFPGRKSRISVADGFLAGTDATDELSPEDLKAAIADMRRIRDWTKRVFGDSVRPTGDGPPVSLLVFRNRDDYLSFFKRLGERWNVEIVPPRGGGYTVQDISACVWDAAATHGQPVALHESVHAVVSRQLRLLPGAPAHAWLQEGLANYLQLCIHPDSLRPGEYADNFSQPIGAKTFFRPLGELLGKPVLSRHYAQLASLTAFLIEEKPDWLRQIARGLADGKELSDILRALGTDLPQLERLWFDWGVRTFVRPAGQPRPERHFPLPEEWTAHPAPAAPAPALAPGPAEAPRS